MNTFAYGMRYWKKHIPCAVFCQILGFLAIALDLLLPLLSALFVDYLLTSNGVMSGEKSVFSFLVTGKYGKAQTWELFWSIAAVFALFVLLREVTIYIRNVLFQHNGLLFENEMRDYTYKKLVELDSSTVAAYNTGELLTTLNSDIITFKEMLSRTLQNLGDSFFVLVLSCVILVLNSAWMLLIPAIIAPVLIVVLARYTRAARRISANIRTNNARLNLTVQENINAVRLVRSFANEELEESKFDSVNTDLKKAYFEHVDVSAKFNMAFNIIRQLTYVATVAIGALLVLKGVFLIGIMTACITYVLKIMDHLTQVSNNMYQLQYGLVSGGRIRDFLEKQTRIPEPVRPEKIGRRPEIEFCDVSITAEGSVLLKSLVRIYDATEGSIRIDGKDVRAYELEELRDDFAYVFQDVFLFSNTVDANIAFYAPDGAKEEVMRVAELAQAGRFIRSLPKGYETIVGEKGLGLSGGQKQRISIARALLKNAPVLVLDDASSALDVITERKLMHSIKENYPDRTLLIAAHRVSSLADCDEILYLQDGEIIERGTFEELIAKNGRFAEIWRMQAEEGVVDDLSAIQEADGGEAQA